MEPTRSKPKAAPSAAPVDEAVLAIRELNDHALATMEATDEALDVIDRRVTFIEGRLRGGGLGQAVTPEPKRWTNPGRLSHDEAKVWEWWRGRLLSGAGDESARERGLAVMESAMPGELQRVRTFLGAERAAFASSADVVPVTISRLIDHVRSEPSFIADLGLVVPMGSDSHKVPKETTAPAAANYAENEVITEDSHAIGSTTLNSIKGASLRNFSLESVMDATPELVEHWMRRLVDSLDELETAQALEGSGSGNNFTGIKTAASVNEVSLANSGNALADLDLLAQMVTEIPASERDPARCAWFMSSDGLRALLQVQDAASGAPMLGQNPKELFGFRIIVSDRIATTSGTPDTSTLYFGNWRGVAIGRRGDLLIDVVSHGAGAAFASAQVSARVIRRYAVSAHLPALLVRGIGLRVAA